MSRFTAVLLVLTAGLIASPALAASVGPPRWVATPALACPEQLRPAETLLKLSKAGDGAASFELSCLAALDGEPANMLKWLKVSADQGDLRGIHGMGDRYMDGEGGLTIDTAEAIRWYQKGVDLGDPWSMTTLGVLYARGIGVEKDTDKAIALYQRASDLGVMDATYNLAVLYLDPPPVGDPAKAAALMRKAAEAGMPEAMFNFGLMNALGTGVPKNVAEAVRWYRKAADTGLAEGQLAMGHAYIKGEGVPADMVEAVRWLRLASDNNSADAAYLLGLAYLNGEGVKKDELEGLRYVRLAASRGSKSAIKLLKDNNLSLN